MTDDPRIVHEKGLRRIWRAFLDSLRGLKHAVRNEAAFRQEIALLAVLAVAALALPLEPILKLILCLCHMGILIVELLNTAIEAVVDKASPEYHELARNAKDMGSAAVMLSFGAAVAAWVCAIASTAL